MIRLAVSFAAFALVACSGGQQSETPSASPTPEASTTPAPTGPYASCTPVTISGDGWCGLTFGMSASQIEATPPFPVMRMAGDNMGDPGACYMYTSVEGPGGLGLMIEEQKLQRIDIGLEDIRTPEGVGVGDSEDKLKAAYGAMATSGPDKYDPKVTLHSVTSGAGKLVFEVEGGRVRALRAGVTPQIDYVERCG